MGDGFAGLKSRFKSILIMSMLFGYVGVCLLILRLIKPDLFDGSDNSW